MTIEKDSFSTIIDKMIVSEPELKIQIYIGLFLTLFSWPIFVIPIQKISMYWVKDKPYLK